MIAVNPFAGAFLLAGVAVIVLAGVGLFKLKTPYARIHAAGKASPVAFLPRSNWAGQVLRAWRSPAWRWCSRCRLRCTCCSGLST
jgi:hypothetical protein